MKRIMMLLLCIVFVMAGCQGNTDDKIGEKEGVYYPKISDREVSNRYSGGLYTYCTLYYGGHIYNSIEGNYTEVQSTLDKSELNLDEILGDELGSIFGNNGIYWSTDKEKLYEVTHEGTLYKVKGYDDEFRVCVYYETIYDFPQGVEHFYHLEVFECLNDITLDKGSELFRDYFHLENAVELKAIADEKSCQLSVENSTVQAFLKALNSGDFIASEDEEYPTFDDSKWCTLVFIDDFGFKKAISVYDNGYVTTKSQEGDIMVIKVYKESCKAIINMVNDLSSLKE